MALALFDLDNTLIAGDSDYLWGQFVVEQGIVDADEYAARNDQFYQDYLRGELDMLAWVEFTAEPLTRFSLQELAELHDVFMRKKIQPIRLSKAEALIEKHRAAGDTLVIITATNQFITAPIAAMLGVENLIATQLDKTATTFTGKLAGEPCYQQGKILHLEAWLKENPHSMDDSYFYSDSHNDIPLLSLVARPFAVNPDETLANHAKHHHWPILDLRDA